jgi:hypothetical protein
MVVAGAVAIALMALALWWRPAQPLPAMAPTMAPIASASAVRQGAVLDAGEFATVVAALGQQADGDASAWQTLPERLRAAADPLRPLLTDPGTPMPGLVVVTPRGVLRMPQSGADPATEAALRAAGLARLDEVRRTDLARVDGAFWLLPDPGALRVAPGGHQVSGSGTWAGITHDPARQGGRLLVRDPSRRHALILVSGDPATVRLDGGCLVPGRAYRIDGQAVIDASAPVGFDLRPVEALHRLWERPILPPAARG